MKTKLKILGLMLIATFAVIVVMVGVRVSGWLLSHPSDLTIMLGVLMWPFMVWMVMVVGIYIFQYLSNRSSP